MPVKYACVMYFDLWSKVLSQVSVTQDCKKGKALYYVVTSATTTGDVL